MCKLLMYNTSDYAIQCCHLITSDAGKQNNGAHS